MDHDRAVIPFFLTSEVGENNEVVVVANKASFDTLSYKVTYGYIQVSHIFQHFTIPYDRFMSHNLQSHTTVQYFEIQIPRTRDCHARASFRAPATHPRAEKRAPMPPQRQEGRA